MQVKYFTPEGEYLAELPDDEREPPSAAVVPSRAAQWWGLAGLLLVGTLMLSCLLAGSQVADWISRR